MIIQKKITALLIPAFFFILTVLAAADTAKEPKQVLPYRGMRKPHKDGVFYVTKLEIEQEQHDMLEIELKFNMPVDPRTLQRQQILINAKPLPADALLHFNKAGDKLKILIQQTLLFTAANEQTQALRIALPEARSFNNMPLYQNHFENLSCDTEYSFKFVKPQRQASPEVPDTFGEYQRFEERDK